MLGSEGVEHFGGMPDSRGDGAIGIRVLRDGRRSARETAVDRNPMNRSVGAHDLNHVQFRERGRAEGNS